MPETIKTDLYLTWLIHLVGAKVNYSRLMTILFNTPFVWVEGTNDINRAEDGKALRIEYMRTFGYERDTDPDIWDEFMNRFEPNVLEVLIGVARRLEDTLGKPGHPDTTPWFMTLIENLELAKMTDLRLEKGPEGANRVRTIENVIHRFMTRNYRSDGAGSLFPLRRNYRNLDMRQVEIWYQMQAWMEENYS